MDFRLSGVLAGSFMSTASSTVAGGFKLQRSAPSVTAELRCLVLSLEFDDLTPFEAVGGEIF